MISSKHYKAARDRAHALYKGNFIEEILPEILAHLSQALSPEEIFDDVQLEAWARDNGFRKPEEVLLQ